MSGAAFLYGSLIHPPSPLIQQQRYHYLSPPIPIRPLCISPLTTAVVSTTSVLQRDSAVELASSSPSIDSNDAVSPQNETVELETERHTDETVPPPLSSEYKETRLRKKKEDDVVSDNRFKLRNGREVSTRYSLFFFFFFFFIFIIFLCLSGCFAFLILLYDYLEFSGF